jgi:hypothetical protein
MNTPFRVRFGLVKVYADLIPLIIITDSVGLFVTRGGPGDREFLSFGQGGGQF